VIQRIAKKFYLRLDNAVIAVHNEAFDALGEADASGTTIDGITRETKAIKGEK
jgi:hypothetical protein